MADVICLIQILSLSRQWGAWAERASMSASQLNLVLPKSDSTMPGARNRNSHKTWSLLSGPGCVSLVGRPGSNCRDYRTEWWGSRQGSPGSGGWCGSTARGTKLSLEVWAQSGKAMEGREAWVDIDKSGGREMVTGKNMWGPMTTTFRKLLMFQDGQGEGWARAWMTGKEWGQGSH